MTGGIWVEGSTCGRGGLPESQERRNLGHHLFGPQGEEPYLFVLPKVEPTRAKPYSPPSPKTEPKSRAQLLCISFNLGLRTGSVCPSGLRRILHLGIRGYPPRSPSPTLDSPGAPSPLGRPPPGPSNYPLGINDTLIFSEWSLHRGESSPPFPVPNYKLLLPTCLLAAQFPNSD